jgi:hypothetical protein
MSPSLNSAEPATRTVAPASTHDFPVNSLTPPSTDISKSLPFSAAQSLTYDIFGMHSAMKDCPPKPGWTVMIRARSTRGRYSSSSVTGVSGFTDIPALIPRALISCMAARMSPTASQCTVTRSQPASAKSLTYLRGSWIIRCASNGMSECFLIALMTGAPNVMFGTNIPSMTSRCAQSAPAESILRSSSPSLEKSADSIEGATLVMLD